MFMDKWEDKRTISIEKVFCDPTISEVGINGVQRGSRGKSDLDGGEVKYLLC